MPAFYDDLPMNILDGFVPKTYPVAKQSILRHGLRSLRYIHADRGWEDWLSVLHAFRLVSEEVVTDLVEDGELESLDVTRVDASKGSPFQRKFLPRWEAYEDILSRLLGVNYKMLSRMERSDLRYLVAHPEVVVWRTALMPEKQRQMVHPRRVVAAYKATHREVDPERRPSQAAQLATNQERVIQNQEVRLEAHRLTIADLQAKLDDHDWNAAEEIGELMLTLVAKLRDRSTREQVEVLRALVGQLGFADLSRLLSPTNR